MTSSKDNKDSNCCTENIVNAVAIQQDWEGFMGYGHTLQTFKVLLYTCSQKKMFEQSPPPPTLPEKENRPLKKKFDTPPFKFNCVLCGISLN